MGAEQAPADWARDSVTNSEIRRKNLQFLSSY